MAKLKGTAETAEILFQRPRSLTARPIHYCPGCGHGILHRLVAEVIDELGIRERTILVAPVGCAVFAYDYFDVDAVEAPHGRAPAVATAIKRLEPGKVVFTYQGDGDLAAIGLAELVHSAVRGENITVVFANNAIYGMTGGQMAPTTLPGMKTTSTPQGRKVATAGYPIKVPELLASQDGVAYLARVSLHSPREVRRALKAIKLAFRVQVEKLGFSLVEALSPCPVGWGLEPVHAMDWIGESMVKTFPLGEFKVSPRVKELLIPKGG